MKTVVRLVLNGLASEASDWALRVGRNGGAVSDRTKRAVSAFVRGCKQANVWDKINRINLFCGDDLNACLVPLKIGSGAATDTNVNFVGADYSEATGLTGDGATKYLKTGLIPSTALTANSTHLAVYNRAADATGGNLHIGNRSGTDFFELIAPFTTGSVIARQYSDSNATGRITSAAITAPYGLMVSSRTSSTAHVAYEHGSAAGTNNAAAGGSMPAIELYVFATNNAGAMLGPIAQAMGGYSIGAGLSAADVTAYTSHMEDFQDALGRGVI